MSDNHMNESQQRFKLLALISNEVVHEGIIPMIYGRPQMIIWRGKYFLTDVAAIVHKVNPLIYYETDSIWNSEKANG